MAKIKPIHIVSQKEPITLIGGGECSASLLARATNIGRFLIAADGGADVAFEFGKRPDALIGDLDSVSAESLSKLRHDQIHKISEQDTTDFEKCLSRIAAPLVVGVGFEGGRKDHELACLNVLVRYPQQRCVLISSDMITFLAPPRLVVELKPGDLVSLFPMTRVRGWSEGLEWPIQGLAFAPDGRIGTSNRAVGSVALQFDQPGMLIMLELSNLEQVCTALQNTPEVWG